MASVSIVGVARRGGLMECPILVAGGNLYLVQLKIPAGFDGDSDC